MSRNLPARPNLEHLRKQARTLQTELRAERPDIQLADAQFQLAREYGFPSWPKLKAFVETTNAAAEHLPNVPLHPLQGSWAANLARSKLRPDFPFRESTLEFGVRGDTVSIGEITVDQTGRRASSHSLTADGRARPHPDRQEYLITAAWEGPGTLRVRIDHQGNREGEVEYSVSRDGRLLTVRTPDQEVVFDRVGAA